MRYRVLANPHQPQYFVKGHKEALAFDELATVSSSEKSLILKPDNSTFARGTYSLAPNYRFHYFLRVASHVLQVTAKKRILNILRLNVYPRVENLTPRLSIGPQTPSRTDASEQDSLHQHLREAEARALKEQRQIAQQAQSKNTHDALDDAIAEVALVKDLVSLFFLLIRSVSRDV